MVYCPGCGEELPDGAEYCSRCGRRLSDPSRTPSPRRSERSEWLDTVGFGVFLLAVAWLTLRYPSVWEGLFSWIQSLSYGWRMIPLGLVEPVAVFFTIMGGWGIAKGVIRGTTGGRPSRAVGDIVGGCGEIAVAYLLRGYSAGAIDAGSIGSYVIIILGCSAVASGVISSLLNDR